MSKVKEKEQLKELIPDLVNRIGQVGAAKQLDISPATVNVWLKNNGYVKQIRYVKKQS